LDKATQSWKRNRTWFCPAAARPLYNEDGSTTSGSAQDGAWGIYNQQDYSRLGPDGIAGSYGLNGYAIDIASSRSRFLESGVSASDGWQHFDNVTVADKVPLFLDAARFDLWPLPGDAPGPQNALLPAGANMAHCCIDRHGGAVNCLFLDGSARKVGLKELWTLKWYRSFDTDGPWTLAGGAMSTDWPEWMRGFKDY
jgi:prepilin-type processing-associated H-X9-DG protein